MPPDRKDRIVLYTAFTKGYDALASPPAHWSAQAECIAFAEDPSDAPGWQFRPLSRCSTDPCRSAKIYKICPHLYLDAADISIWIDASISVTSPRAVEEFCVEALGDLDMAVFRHRKRSCIYEEADACVALGKDDPAVIALQVEAYRSLGYPEKNGLAECCVLVRRHNKVMEAFNEAWMREIDRYSRRDQLSFNYVASNHRLKFSYLPGRISRNDHFSRHAHLKNAVATTSAPHG